jgi:hypothetical protein
MCTRFVICVVNAIIFPFPFSFLSRAREKHIGFSFVSHCRMKICHSLQPHDDFSLSYMRRDFLFISILCFCLKYILSLCLQFIHHEDSLLCFFWNNFLLNSLRYFYKFFFISFENASTKEIWRLFFIIVNNLAQYIMFKYNKYIYNFEFFHSLYQFASDSHLRCSYVGSSCWDKII